MKIVNAIMTNNPCYKRHKKFTPKGLMLHSVGCAQPAAKVFVNQWNKSTYRTSCVHGVIDATSGDVYQTLPWNYAGWHGGNPSNNTHIGVEMCEPSSIKYTSGANFTITNIQLAQAAARTTYQAAVELFAKLCKDFNLDPLKKGVIVSHSEGHKLGIATNHADPEHLWKGLKMSYTMDGFRKDVAIKMGAKPVETDHGSEKTEKFQPYTVRVVVTDLNIRIGPSTKYQSQGHVKPGVYTIVEEKDGWGLLKAYAAKRNGWIYLRYANPV